MKTKKMKRGKLLLIFGVCLSFLIGIHTGYSQQIKWLRITPLQTPVNEAGAEYENEFPVGNTNFFSWPAQYGIGQNTCRQKFIFIGCRNFDDPQEKKIKSYKVIGVNRNDASPTMIFPQTLRLIGKRNRSIVVVDDQPASVLDAYDILDKVDPNLEADRIIDVTCNTSIGVSFHKRQLAFDHSNHDNYHVKEWTFTNTGIYDAAGNVKQQTLDSVWFFFVDRYAFAGVSCTGFGLGWGSWQSTWGESNYNHSFGEDPNASGFEMRGQWTSYGPDVKKTSLLYAEDWGNPSVDEEGQLASAKFAGTVTLHADKSPTDQSDDLWQPRTNNFIGSDITPFQASSQYDEVYMADRWACITDGHPPIQHDVLIDDAYPFNYNDPRRTAGGGTMPEYAYGPYKMAPGDSIHIVFAEAVAGISWEKGREVCSNWQQWYRRTGTPTLIMPDGSTTTDHNLYKRRWVETGKDSIMQTYRNAMRNYASGYTLAVGPPPPDAFTILSGGDRIMLSWSNSAEGYLHFGGYVVYRSVGNVLNRNSVYTKIFECGKSDVKNSFDDLTAVRGFDYYYYVQTKDDGTQNDLHPNQPLYSSLFWTVTSVPAQLQRPAVTGPPTSPVVDTTHWNPLVAKGAWTANSYYYPSDEVTYNGISYVCVRLDSGMATPDTLSRWKPTVSKGEWVSGNSFAKYSVVSYSGVNYYCISEVAQGSMLEQVRVVPNPYDIRNRMFQFGDQNQYDRIAFYGLPPVCKMKIFTERGDLVWEKDHIRGTGDELWDSQTSSGQIITSGIYILYVETPEGQSVYRKFVVIR
jgi:hypothetical protein